MSNYSDSSTPTAQSSSMALISLISGILGLTLVPIVGSIVALITGYMAKNEIRESAARLEGEGLATAGIVLGWVGVGLTVFGFCIVGTIFLVPACLIPLGIISNQSGWFLPMLGIFI